MEIKSLKQLEWAAKNRPDLITNSSSLDIRALPTRTIARNNSRPKLTGNKTQDKTNYH